MKKIKYKVNGDFGLSEIDSIIDAYLVIENSGFGLLYHPWEKGFSPSFEIGCFKDGYWTSQDYRRLDRTTYVNVTMDAPVKFEKKLLKLLKKDD